ncbi:uncharacterized protein [Aquarana catesbeiana]|uniref:uncharacterized protein n=1 Tax=Aquarana catesbeiana TaxID=8400 RepID=UPI003CCA4E06
MMDNQPPLTSPDGSSNGNPPERCPRPLYSRDSTQQGHSYAKHDQSVVKEEYKEEDVVMEEFSEGHKDVKMEPPNTRNPPERCPHPLYSRDYTQEDHTISHHHQSGNLGNDNIDVKEEDEEYGVMRDFSEGHKDMMGTPNTRNPPERCPLYSRDSTQDDHSYAKHDRIVVKEEYKEEDEEYGVMEEFSEGHKDMMEPPNTRNPPERCPRPLYSRDSTQGDHTIPHCYKSGDPIDIEFEVKSEEEETFVKDDQQSMEEDGITGTFIEEDTLTEISTGGSLTLNGVYTLGLLPHARV